MNALTQQLADALRRKIDTACLRDHTMHLAVHQECVDALAAFDAAREKPLREIIASLHTGGTVDIHDLNRAISAYVTVKP